MNIKIIDLYYLKDIELLKKVYEEIYFPNFSYLEDECELLEDYIDRVIFEKLENPKTHFFVALSNDDVAGFLIAEHYNISNSCLLTYSAISDKFKGQGIFKLLLEASKELCEKINCNSIFAEAHNPLLVDADKEPIDPFKRLQIFSSCGFYIVPVDYVQPPLFIGGRKCSDLLFLTLTPNIKHSDVIDFYKEFYEVLTEQNADDKEVFNKIKTQIDKSYYVKFNMPIINLDS